MDFWPLKEGATPDTIAVTHLNEQVAGFGSMPSYLSKIPVEQLEIEHTQASDSEDLLLRVKPTLNAKGKDLTVRTIIEVHPSVRVNVVNSDVERLADTRFVNATDGLDGADIGGINGTLQADVGELSVSDMMVSLTSSGEVNILLTASPHPIR